MNFFLSRLAIPILVTLCWTVSSRADSINHDTGFLLLGLTLSSSSSFIWTTDPFFDHKLVPARHDAAAFVASDGQLRGAQLESALLYLRQTQPKLHASDLELAQAILVQ